MNQVNQSLNGGCVRCSSVDSHCSKTEQDDSVQYKDGLKKALTVINKLIDRISDV